MAWGTSERMNGGSNIRVQLWGTKARVASCNHVTVLIAICATRARTRRSMVLYPTGHSGRWRDCDPEEGNLGGAAGAGTVAGRAAAGRIWEGAGRRTIPFANLTIMTMPAVTSAMLARNPPKNASPAWGWRILALGVSPPLMNTNHAMRNRKKQPPITRMVVTTMPRVRSVLAAQRSTVWRLFCSVQLGDPNQYVDHGCALHRSRRREHSRHSAPASPGPILAGSSSVCTIDVVTRPLHSESGQQN